MALNENPTLKEIVDETERLNNLIVNRGGAQSITPTTTNKVLLKGYYKGDITIKGDASLVASNILAGKSIFGVAGNLELGKKWASGNCTMSTSNHQNGSYHYRFVDATYSLNFNPSIVICFFPAVASCCIYVSSQTYIMTGTGYSNGRYSLGANGTFVNSNGFKLPIRPPSNTAGDGIWYAFE